MCVEMLHTVPNPVSMAKWTSMMLYEKESVVLIGGNLASYGIFADVCIFVIPSISRELLASSGQMSCRTSRPESHWAASVSENDVV